LSLITATECGSCALEKSEIYFCIYVPKAFRNLYKNTNPRDEGCAAGRPGGAVYEPWF